MMYKHMNAIREKMVNPDRYINNLFDRNDNVILDYGCGVGFYCRYLRRFASKLYCIDIDEEALEEVKTHISGAITLTDVGPPLSIRMSKEDYIKAFPDFKLEKEFESEPNHYGLVLKRY